MNCDLYDRTAVEALPDGTIISWLRIPGDPTSAAVAFVRSEIDADVLARQRRGESPLPPVRTVWISPGGWQPMTIEDAGINYPVLVLRWGNGPRDDQPVPPEYQRITAVPEPDPPEFLPLLHGGTWARETALTCAAQIWTSAALVDPENAAVIIATAEVFETWLNRKADQ